MHPFYTVVGFAPSHLAPCAGFFAVQEPEKEELLAG